MKSHLRTTQNPQNNEVNSGRSPPYRQRYNHGLIWAYRGAEFRRTGISGPELTLDFTGEGSASGLATRPRFTLPSLPLGIRSGVRGTPYVVALPGVSLEGDNGVDNAFPRRLWMHAGGTNFLPPLPYLYLQPESIAPLTEEEIPIVEGATQG